MKYLFLKSLLLVFLNINNVYSNEIDYKDWLNNNKFKTDLYNEINSLLLFQLPNIKNKEKENLVTEEINIHLNKISNLQYNYFKLREECQSQYSEFSFNFFLDIEKCIKNKKTKLINNFLENEYDIVFDDKKLFLNAKDFTDQFINLHSHEVKKENYDKIMENYYKNIENINFEIFEYQFLIVIKYFINKYNLNFE